MTQLPEGWIGSVLRDLVQPRSEKVEPSDVAPDLPYVSLEHIDPGAGHISMFGRAADVRSTKTRFRKGDVLYGKLRPYLNKVAIANHAGICSTDLLVFPGSAILNNGYLARFLSTREVVEYAHHSSTGVQLPRVSFSSLGMLAIPVPPIAEQRRIAERIEVLLGRVDAARDRLQTVTRLLRRLRQSALAAACTGSLPLTGSKWRQVTLGDVTLSSFYGPRFPSTAYGDGVPTVRTSDMDFRGNINLDGAPCVQILDRDADRFLLQEGDLLVTRTGATIGKCAVYKASLGPAIPSAYLIRFRLERSVAYPTFVLMFLMSPAGQQLLLGGQTAVAQPNVNAEAIKSFQIELPALTEQREIVRRVDSLLALTDAIEKRVAAARARAEKLTQAILAKAFAGELVPTEAELARREGRDYEPASVLIERIRRKRPTATKAVRSSRPRPRRG